MFALSIVLLALAVVAAKFTLFGQVGGAEGPALIVIAGTLSVICMVAYVRKARARRRAV